MEIKRTTEIFVETNRRFVIHQPQSAEQIFCPRCAGPLLTAEQSAALFKVSPRDIYRLIENDKVHFTETEAAAVLLCPTSLAEILGDDRNNCQPVHASQNRPSATPYSLVKS